MNLRTCILALIAVAFSAHGVFALDGIFLRTNGVRLRMIPDDRGGISSTHSAGARCQLRIRNTGVVLHWATEAFHHTERPDIRTDASMRARVRQKTRGVGVSPAAVADRTAIRKGDESAEIAMAVVGRGQADIDFQIEIRQRRAVAGKHCANVVLTVLGQ